MLARLLYIPVWIASLAVEFTSRGIRAIIRFIFDLLGVGDDDVYEEENRKRRGGTRRAKRKLRKYSPLLVWGLGLTVIAAVGILFLVRSSKNRQTRLAARYQLALAEAITNGKDKEADLYERKLAQLGVRTDAGDFQAAVAMAKSGDLARAYTMMQSLASADSPGFPLAHLWQAQQLIDGAIDLPASSSLPLALKHLGHVKNRTGNLAQIRFMQGIAFAKMGRVDEAVDSFLQVTDEIPSANAMLMQLRSSSGDADAAKTDAKAVMEYLKRRKKNRKPLNSQELQWQFAAAKLIGDPETLTRSAAEWHEADPDNLKARFGLASEKLRAVDRWLSEVDDRWADGDDDPVEQLKDAIELLPDAEFGRARQTLVQVWNKRVTSIRVRSFYDRLMNSEEGDNTKSLPGKAIEFFGTSAAAGGDWETADLLLGQATEVDPLWSHAWNNRAFVLREAYPDRLKEAIGYANKAIELDPSNAEFRETRGMLLIRVASWEAAAADLEIALNGLVEQSKPIHLALATAYRNLGDEKLAKLHERSAL